MDNFTNYLTLENITFSQPLDTLVSILFFFSIYMFSEKICKKNFLLTENKIINKNLVIIIIIIFISYLSFFYSILYNKIYIVRYLILFILIICLLYSFEKKLFNLKFNFFTIFLIIYFLLSLSPPTDADSLDYHLGYPLEILRNGNFPRYDWFHSWLIGIGDYVNYFGLLIGSKNIGQMINFFGLLIIYNNFKFLKDKFKINNQIFLFLFSTPLLIWFITSQKPQLFPAAVIFTSFILLDINFRNIYLKFLIITIFLIYVFLSKISFMFSMVVIYLYLIFLNKNSLGKLFLCSLIALLFTLPIFLKNYLSYSDLYPPLMATILGIGDIEFINFSEGLARDKASFKNLGIFQTIFFPLFLSIPQKISNMSIFLSIGFNIFFIIAFMAKAYKTKEFWFVLIVAFIILYLPNYQPRYFLEVYLVLIILVAKYFNKLNNNILFKYFKYILLVQSVIIFFFSLLSIFTLTIGSISPSYYKLVMTKNAYNYNITRWINNNIPKNATVVSNIVRSHALYQNNFVSRERFFLKPIENSLKYKPEYVVLNQEKDKSLLEFKKKCLTKIKQKLFFIEKRNFLSRRVDNKFKATLYLNKCK